MVWNNSFHLEYRQQINEWLKSVKQRLELYGNTKTPFIMKDGDNRYIVPKQKYKNHGIS